MLFRSPGFSRRSASIPIIYPGAAEIKPPPHAPSKPRTHRQPDIAAGKRRMVLQEGGMEARGDIEPIVRGHRLREPVAKQIGRATCRARVRKYLQIPVWLGNLQK